MCLENNGHVMWWFVEDSVRFSAITVVLHVKVVVKGLDDLRGHDAAHEKDRPYEKKRELIHKWYTYMFANTVVITDTCFSASDDEEEGMIGHDLRVQHQRPGQRDHTCRRSWRHEIKPDMTRGDQQGVLLIFNTI